MDVGTATSQSAYTYQATVQSGGQSTAVLQALTQAYSNSSANALDNADPLAALAGASAVGALVSGITTLTQAAAGTQNAPVAGLQSASFGGLDTNSASALLASISSTSDTGGLQGFDGGVSAGATLAIAAYQAQQSYPVTAPAAQGSPSSTPTTTLADTTSSSSAPAAVPQATGTGTATPDPNSAAGLQQAIAAAINPSVLSLLA